MQISKLAEEQIPQAVALWEATGLTRPWNDPCADAIRALENSTSTVLAVSEGSQVIATAMVGHDGHRGWLYYVAVDPQFQRTGLGAQVVQAASAWLAAARRAQGAADGSRGKCRGAWLLRAAGI
ncbi:GNAT family N-acetyltransferase [Glutamicibacter halophytocola]|uniref:GNAT family N-acetyltransferase n=1 Tax=Glutamicibacter halophytocola TaxID=1933880 RepID=UPI00321A6940